MVGSSQQPTNLPRPFPCRFRSPFFPLLLLENCPPPFIVYCVNTIISAFACQSTCLCLCLQSIDYD